MPPLLTSLAAHEASAPPRINNRRHMILPCTSRILKRLHIHSNLDEWLPHIRIWVSGICRRRWDGVLFGVWCINIFSFLISVRINIVRVYMTPSSFLIKLHRNFFFWLVNVWLCMRGRTYSMHVENSHAKTLFWMVRIFVQRFGLHARDIVTLSNAFAFALTFTVACIYIYIWCWHSHAHLDPDRLGSVETQPQ